MSDACTVTFEGTQGGTYYVACNLVKYLDNEHLFNTGSSTIYLYKNFLSSQSQTGLTIPALSYPYYTSNNVRYYITNANNISFNLTSSIYRELDMVQVVLLALVVAFSFINRILGRVR